jgi:hypothetical protein
MYVIDARCGIKTELPKKFLKFLKPSHFTLTILHSNENEFSHHSYGSLTEENMTSMTTNSAVADGHAKEVAAGPISDSIAKSHESPFPLIENFDDVVSGIDIPEFLCTHRANLRFPETVSSSMRLSRL